LVVEGGKAHQLVVEPAGVVAGEQAEATDGVLTDADQAGGLADAAAVGEVGEDGQELVARQAGTEQGRALALGEAGLAGRAVEEAVLLPGAVAHADGEVAVVAPAAVRAGGVEAAEAAEVIQRCASWEVDTDRFLTSWMTQGGRTIQRCGDTIKN
jgi:hypothetical protein